MKRNAKQNDRSEIQQNTKKMILQIMPIYYVRYSTCIIHQRIKRQSIGLRMPIQQTKIDINNDLFL